MSWSPEPRFDLYTPEQIAQAKEFPCQKGAAMSEKYGRLTFVRLAEPKRYKSGSTHVRWEMLCDCGKVHVTEKNRVIRGMTRSCGCLLRDTTAAKGKVTWHYAVAGRFKHGATGTPLFRAWQRMRYRCTEAFQDRNPNYRGVTWGPEWDTFEGFLANQPAGRAYEPGLVLARNGDKGNYERSNCRWATRAENNREMYERHMLRLPDGRFAREVAAANGISGPTFHGRIRKGWSVEEAASRPVHAPKGEGIVIGRV